jgi:hypothetical protein
MDAGLSENPLVYAVEDSSSFIGYVIFHDYDEDNRKRWISNEGLGTRICEPAYKDAH